MAIAFKKATKLESKLRMAISGPAGAGKTWTALTFAIGLANGGSVALIDTEHGSASKYADIFEFDTLELDTFHPNRYIEAIHEAEQAGYAVLVIDSLSHAWSGTGGVLEEKDKIAKQKYGGNSFSAWNDATALQNKLVQAILGSKLHIIATVRSKMEHVQEKDEKTGRSVVRKLGMAPVQRDDLPYEFDVFCSMEIDNTLIVDKSRCPELSGAVISKPDAKVAEVLKAWLQGEPVPEKPALHIVPTTQQDEVPSSEQQHASIRKLCQHLGESEPEYLKAMSFAEAKELIASLSLEYRERRKAQEAREVASPAPDATAFPPTPSQLREQFNRLVSEKKLKGTFETFVSYKLGHGFSDEELTPKLCELIAKHLASYEHAAAGAGR